MFTPWDLVTMDAKISPIRILFGVIVLHIASAEPGFFWHVTDFHYDPTYWTSKLSCDEVVLKPGMFGEHFCDANWNLVEDSILNMLAIKPDVDFVLWTGDSVAHIRDSNASVAFNIEIIQNITKTFRSYFSNSVKFLPTQGNHDFYPSDQADVKKDEIYTKTAEVWKDWITDKDERKQFVNGGFYTMSLSHKIRLMSVNTNLYNRFDRITKGMKDPAGQFAWMERVLKKARNDTEKVIVTAHVTPGVQTPNFVSWMYPDHQKRYVGILTHYHDVIVASHYGHDHTDGFKILLDKDDDSKSVAQFMAPSVAPKKFRIPAHNPGIRLVEYDRATGNHLTYEQYFINLTDANANKKTNWTKLYDFRETYQVPDMSVKSLRSIFSKMAKEDDVGKDLAQTYCNNALVSKEDKECTRKNQFEIVCGGEHYDLTEANKCVEDLMSGGNPSCVGIPFLCVVVSALTTLIKIVS